MSFALKFNSNTVFATGNYKHLTEFFKSKNVNIKNFYLSKVCKTMWNSKERFNIIKSMKADMNLLAIMTTLLTDFHWDIPIRHFIPKVCYRTVTGDSCLA